MKRQPSNGARCDLRAGITSDKRSYVTILRGPGQSGGNAKMSDGVWLMRVRR
jgi:hypothetical protein